MTSAPRLVILVLAIALVVLTGVWLSGWLHDEDDRMHGTRDVPPTPRPQAPVRRVPSSPAPPPASEASVEPETAPGSETISAPPADPSEAVPFGGRVLDAEGAPAGGAQVGLFLTRDGAPRPKAEQVTRCDTEGRFVFIRPPPAPFVLIAHRRAPRPTALLVTDDEGARDVILRLEEGHEMRGRVTYNGAPVVNAHVSVDMRPGVPGVFGLDDELFWIDGRIENKHRSTDTDQRGTFSLSGLGPQRHTVSVSLGRLLSGEDLRTQLRREFVAPTANANIDVGAAEFQFEVRRHGRPAADAEIRLLSPESGREQRFTAHRTEVVGVKPLRDYRVEVRHTMCRTVERHVRAPAAGDRMVLEFDLKDVPRPVLVLTLVGDANAPPARVRVRLDPIETDGEASVLDVWAEPDGAAWRTPPLGTEGGRYRLMVGPGDGSRVERYVITEPVEVHLPPDGVASATVPFTIGGRFEPTFECEGTYDLQWALTDERGTVVENASLMRMDNGISFAFSTFVGGDQIRDIRRGWKVHPPGRYRISASSSKLEPLERTVEIFPGKTTRRTLRMRRR